MKKAMTMVSLNFLVETDLAQLLKQILHIFDKLDL